MNKSREVMDKQASSAMTQGRGPELESPVLRRESLRIERGTLVPAGAAEAKSPRDARQPVGPISVPPISVPGPYAPSRGKQQPRRSCLRSTETLLSNAP